VVTALELARLGGLLAGGSPLVLPSTVFVVLAHAVGFAVAGAWASLAMAGRWRPEADWVESECSYFLFS